MKILKLIYFENCPRVEHVRKLLRSIPEIEVEEVRQDDLSLDDPFRGFSSPTVLCEKRVIYGTEVGSGLGGCSVEPFDLEKVRRLIF